MKIRAAQQGVKLKELAAKYIEAGLRGQPAPSAALRPRAPLPAAIPRDPGTPLVPALSNRELHTILDQEDQVIVQHVFQTPSDQP